MIGAGEVLNIFSDVVLDMLSSDSSVKDAVGITGPGAVSNGLSHSTTGHEVGDPLVLKHCVTILRVRWIVDGVAVVLTGGVEVIVLRDAELVEVDEVGTEAGIRVTFVGQAT